MPRLSAYLPTIALFLVGLPSRAADPAPPVVRLPELAPPVVPPSGAVTKLSASEIYMFDSDVACVVTTSPPGLLAVSREAGPIRIKGIFAGGTGKIETKSFTGKNVWTVDVAATGRAELLIIPAGITDEAGILRRMIDANAGPRPPPVGILTLSASPPSGTAPLTVMFTATGVTSPNASFDFGDGTEPQIVTRLGTASIAHGYAVAGNFTATVTTVDGKTAMASVTVSATPIPPPPPVVKTFRVIFGYESGTPLTAAQTSVIMGKSVEEYLKRKTTPEGEIAGFRRYDKDTVATNDQPNMRALWEAVQVSIKAKPTGIPFMAVEVNGNVEILPVDPNPAAALATLKKYGGD